MAKRAKSLTVKPKTSTSIAEVARDYAAAEAHFTKVEREYFAAKSTLGLLKSAMLKHLGASEAPAAVPSRRVGSPTGRGANEGGDAPRQGTLGDHILKVLAGGQDMGPTEVFEAVKNAGFKSDGTEKSQSVMVTQTLGKLAKKGLIAKKGRGIYAIQNS